MDTLTITPTNLIILGYYFDIDVNPTTATTLTAPINASIGILSQVLGTRQISGSGTADYPRIGFGGFGGIEWSVTCVIPGGDDPDTPVALSPKTYVDAYGKLHLGDEVEVGMVITVNAKLVNRNPSGSGYTIDADAPVTITLKEADGFGNFNHAERYPYIIYQSVDSATPASGAGVGDANED